MNSVFACEINEIIQNYSTKEDNWDGDGALSPKQDDIKNAQKFVNMLCDEHIFENPMVALSSEGEISFVWRDKETGLFIDLGFINGGISYYLLTSSGEERCFDRNEYNENELRQIIANLKQKATYA